MQPIYPVEWSVRLRTNSRTLSDIPGSSEVNSRASMVSFARPSSSCPSSMSIRLNRSAAHDLSAGAKSVTAGSRAATGSSDCRCLFVGEEQSDLRVLPEFSCDIAGSVECLFTVADNSLSQRRTDFLARHRPQTDLLVHQTRLEPRQVQLSGD